MRKASNHANGHTSERTAIRRRVKQFYQALNQDQWTLCFAMIDPKLSAHGRITVTSYAASLGEFKECYGEVRIWYMRTSLHMDVRDNKRDARPFAFVYIVWQDSRDEFHMFRERWVQDAGHWYTRVVGLVVNRAAADANTGHVPR
jgi:hypothetical protein